MMKPTEQLVEEHKFIKTMLRVLEVVCKKLEKGAQVDVEHLEQMVDFIKGYADKCHHATEENILFPEMEKVGIPKEGGPLGVMLMEHDQGREYVRGMSEGIIKYKEGNQEAVSQIISNARGYIALLDQHINKEDQCLYPMADQAFSDEQQQNLAEMFKNAEEKIGVGVREKFLNNLQVLKNIYLLITKEELANKLQLTVDGVKYHIRKLNKRGVLF